MASHSRFLGETDDVGEKIHDDTNRHFIGEKKDIHSKLPSSYSPEYVEATWFTWWEKQGFFRPEYYDEHPPSNASTPRKKFIMITPPPPNVTYHLHLDHAIIYTIEDVLSRWHRMCGETVLWVPIWDPASVETQVAVENKSMHEQKITGHDLEKKKFLEEVWKRNDKNADNFYKEIKALGLSCDWSRKISTMDKSMSYAVEEAFIRMHEKQQIYRSTGLVNWSCALKSAIVDSEIEKIELKGRTLMRVPGYEEPVEFGVLIYFAYLVENSEEEIIVATTRLETMLGDTAVVVHPDDDRYKHLHGRFVQHPFLSRRLPILTDIMVDPAIGSGAIKVTPAHNQHDFAFASRLALQAIVCINDDGCMSQECGPYAGKRRFDVRRELIEDMKARNIYRGAKEHQMDLPICSRNEDIIEPIMKQQWHVNVTMIKQHLIEAVQSGEASIIPRKFQRTWHELCKNAEDWCISRQWWWGHRIPSYLVHSSEIPIGAEMDVDHWVSAHSEEEALDKASKKFNVSKEKILLKQSEDFLDSCFLSSILPFASLGWPVETKELKDYFPMTLINPCLHVPLSLMLQMTMMSLSLTGVLPFKEVHLDQTIDNPSENKHPQGCVNPNEAYPGVSKCGRDAFRFGVCDRFAEDQSVGPNRFNFGDAAQFCDNLWKVIRSTMSKYLSIDDSNCFQPPREFQLNGIEKPLDLWILGRLSNVIDLCENGFQKHQFKQITTAMFNFCPSGGLRCSVNERNITVNGRLSTKDFYPQEPDFEQRNRQNTIKLILYTCLNNGLRIIAPIMPYLSEELYQRLPKPIDEQSLPPSLCVSPYPRSNEFSRFRDKTIEEEVAMITDAIDGINSHYSTPMIAPHESTTLFVKCASPIFTIFKKYLDLFQSTTNIIDIQSMDLRSTCTYTHITAEGDYELYLKLPDPFD